MLLFLQHCPYIKNSRQIYMYKYTSIHIYPHVHAHTHIFIYILSYYNYYCCCYSYLYIYIHAYYGYGRRNIYIIKLYESLLFLRSPTVLWDATVGPKKRLAPTAAGLLDLISVSARISSNADTTEAP